MKKEIWIILCISTLIISGQYVDYSKQNQLSEEKSKAIQFLREYDREASEMCTRVTTLEWRYAINSTDFNRRRMREQQTVSAKFDCISWRRAYHINLTISNDTKDNNNNNDQVDSNLKRQIQRILNKKYCGLDDAKFTEFNHLITLMKDNFKNAKICPFNDNENENNQKQQIKQELHSGSNEPENYVIGTTTYCNLKLEPDIMRIMQQSRSEKELKYIWTAWRNAVGPSSKNSFMRYINLANQAAQAHGFKDAGEQMRSIYEDPNFYFTVQDLWSRIQPFYKQLFTFVRKGLIKIYGEHLIRKDGPIPAHLLGDLWAQNWRNILDLIRTSSMSSALSSSVSISSGLNEMPDVTSELIRQGYTPLKIFQTAEDFFTSMGLPPMLPEFWRNSMFQKPNENIFTQCTPSSWDFCNGIDFRIRQCTRITLEDFISAHREMTYIEHYMHYSNLPIIYRDGPNPAFPEAIANAIGLCVSGPIHLQKIGLISKSLEIESGNSMLNIEFLLNIALDKIPFMAFSLTLEKWRWHVFEKGPVGMNSRWWELNLRYMGIKPPIPRTNEHFDPGAKYHVIADKDYIKYFMATVLQFQIFAELCQASGHNGALHTCDFYRSRNAGRILTDLMQQGASLTSSQFIKLLTRGRTSQVSIEPLVEYFRPLIAWLEIQNRDETVVGWSSNMDDVALYQPLHSNSAVRWNQIDFLKFYIWSFLILFFSLK